MIIRIRKLVMVPQCLASGRLPFCMTENYPTFEVRPKVNYAFRNIFVAASISSNSYGFNDRDATPCGASFQTLTLASYWSANCNDFQKQNGISTWSGERFREFQFCLEKFLNKHSMLVLVVGCVDTRKYPNRIWRQTTEVGVHSSQYVCIAYA